MFKLEKRLTTLIGIINLVILFLIFSDYYLFDHRRQTYLLEARDAIFNTGQSPDGGGTRDWTNYFILSGKEKFEVPYKAYRILTIGDSFTISKTGIFKRPLLLECKQESLMTQYSIGKLENIWILYALIISIIISLLILVVDYLNLDNYRSRLTSGQVVALGITSLNFIIYLT